MEMIPFFKGEQPECTKHPLFANMVEAAMGAWRHARSACPEAPLDLCAAVSIYGMNIVNVALRPRPEAIAELRRHGVSDWQLEDTLGSGAAFDKLAGESTLPDHVRPKTVRDALWLMICDDEQRKITGIVAVGWPHVGALQRRPSDRPS